MLNVWFFALTGATIGFTAMAIWQMVRSCYGSGGLFNGSMIWFIIFYAAALICGMVMGATMLSI